MAQVSKDQEVTYSVPVFVNSRNDGIGVAEGKAVYSLFSENQVDRVEATG
jgi:hypothetical protein